jgi:hypothetical protein
MQGQGLSRGYRGQDGDERTETRQTRAMARKAVIPQEVRNADQPERNATWRRFAPHSTVQGPTMIHLEPRVRFALSFLALIGALALIAWVLT